MRDRCLAADLTGSANSSSGPPVRGVTLRETSAQSESAPTAASTSGKRFDATEDRSLRADQREAASRVPRSCIRVRSREDVLKRTKIVLALPSYNRQRLSGIRRGWCPPCDPKRIRRVLRSDVGDAHRLSLSDALSISENQPSQGETQQKKRFFCLQNWRVRHPLRPSDMGSAPAIRQPQNGFISG